MIRVNENDIERRKQEMLDSMPSYYKESPEVNAIMRGNAQEIERKRAEAQDLLDQMFVSTATWGLDYWDRVLDLAPAPRMSIRKRRERILVKLNGTEPATKANLTKILNLYTQNKDAFIVEYPNEYRFEGIFPADETVEMNPADIYKAINEVKPAHLEFLIHIAIGLIAEVRTKQYTFPVPYQTTGTFHTAPINGVADKVTVEAESKSYTYQVPYPVTGTFYCSSEGGY
ncbi:putative phage tail protein [Sporosarcina sp. FSL K6-3508]|uniref:putative phage tail protein n=1 Tax=Sporosarcina sp. FSL K6-3508 TaxID=2921557 RepID=UPI00315B23F4